MWLRDLAPGLFLRLGRDQECYDFVKWWSLCFHPSKTDLKASWLDTRGADMFEDPIAVIQGERTYLLSLVAITLLKIRLLISLVGIQCVKREAGPHLPQELLDLITAQFITPALEAKQIGFRAEDLRPPISELRKQIRSLFEAVQNKNRYIWLALVRPGNHLSSKPRYSGTGRVQEMQTELPWIYNAWSETPGAIGLIEELQKMDRKA